MVRSGRATSQKFAILAGVLQTVYRLESGADHSIISGNIMERLMMEETAVEVSQKVEETPAVRAGKRIQSYRGLGSPGGPCADKCTWPSPGP